MNRCPPRLNRVRPPQALRRGAALYVAVTGTTMIVSVLGLSAMAIVRIERQQAMSVNARQIARSHARSAVELGLQRINSNPSWRTIYSNGVETTVPALGNNSIGSVSWSLSDADGDLANSDGVLRLKGIGRIGSTVQVSSVEVRAGETAGVLRKNENVTLGIYDDSQNDTLRNNKWWTQYLIPALPTGANGWRITGVAVRARRNVAGQLFSVRLYRLSGGNFTLLEGAEGLNSNSVPASYGWFTVPFAGTTPLEVGDGICLVLHTTSTSSPIRLSFDNDVDSPDNINSALARDRSSLDADDFTSSEALQYRIEGAYTTSDDVRAEPHTWDWDTP
jgi:Tfp pilus assembly protein PilX